MDWLSGQDRRAWLDRQGERLDNALAYYLGPHAAPVNALAQIGAMVSPGQDFVDMHEGGTELMRGNALSGVGLMGGGILGMAIPGSASGYRKAADDVVEGIRAYHGSPHDFDRFDLSKIGTGEGAQAYGHGLYFAENEGVAKEYREQLTRGGRGQVAAYRVAGQDVPVSDKQAADIAHMMRTYNIDPATPDGEEWLSSEIGARGLPSSIRDKIDQFLQAGVEREDMTGRMYEVRINADPADFLDWDKPLSEQSEKVRAAIKQAGGNVSPVRLKDGRYAVTQVQPDGSGKVVWSISEDTPEDALSAYDKWISEGKGEGAYHQLAGGIDITPGNVFGETSSRLREAGIPGIRYLDQCSRAAGDGSRNYVVFDDSLIEIMRKYGFLGSIGIGGAVGVNALAQPEAEQY